MERHINSQAYDIHRLVMREGAKRERSHSSHSNSKAAAPGNPGR
jgi:hypothetical protein